VAGILREIGTGLVRGNFVMKRPSLGLLAGVAGFMPGAGQPTETSGSEVSAGVLLIFRRVAVADAHLGMVNIELLLPLFLCSTVCMVHTFTRVMNCLKLQGGHGLSGKV
jgi:hypothetical protein